MSLSVVLLWPQSCPWGKTHLTFLIKLTYPSPRKWNSPIPKLLIAASDSFGGFAVAKILSIGITMPSCDKQALMLSESRSCYLGTPTSISFKEIENVNSKDYHFPTDLLYTCTYDFFFQNPLDRHVMKLKTF